jgi:hypothetical protein
MMIKIYEELTQGSDEWFQARCGLLTASEMKLIITPTLKISANEKTRAHVYELAAQRVTQYTEPSYIGDDMMRGWEDEGKAKAKYSEHYAPITDVGFITNDKWGFTIGYSPDGLVGDDGAVECKSRRQKFQMETIVNNFVPDEYLIQCQTGLLVTERKWLDYISYCGGMPMCVIRVYPDDEVQTAIIEAAQSFEIKVAEVMAKYNENIDGLITTERTIESEMIV